MKVNVSVKGAKPMRTPVFDGATAAAVLQPKVIDASDPESEPKRKGLTNKQCLLCVGALSLCWMLVTTFAAPPLGANSGKDGEMCVGTPTAGKLCLCPRETLCATKWHEVVFLAFARASAYFDYPLYMLLFLSKCHNLRGAMYRTYLKEWLPLNDMHHLHAFAGTFVSVEIVWHSFWHIVRWGAGGDIRFLWQHRTGITGLISLLCTPLIAYPMMFQRLRKSIPYERRKAMHYLSAVWGLSIMFHAPATNIFWVMGACVCLYLGDWLVGYFVGIRYCPTLKMTRLGASAVEIVFEHPPGFVNTGGNYVYICLPWLGKAEWHAFSLYAHPTLENHSSVCIAKLGDWTSALHNSLVMPISKPGWVYGPFPSPFSGATDADSMVCVASGIGITPTLGIIKTLSASRKVNVVWMCKQADLIEYFLRTVTFDDDAWTIIYYTGKRKLVLSEEQFKNNPRVLLLQGRPDLKQIILDIIYACEMDGDLPPATLDKALEMHHNTFHCGDIKKFKALVEKMLVTYSVRELFEIATRCTLLESFDVGKTVMGGTQVTLEGFCRFVNKMAAAPGLLDEKEMARVFAELDLSGDGFLNEEEFDKAMKTLSSVEESAQNVEKEKANELERLALLMSSGYVFRESKPSFSNWQLLYCGGTAAVVKTVNEMRDELGVQVSIESFEW
jgi:ferric-chelate reductase